MQLSELLENRSIKEIAKMTNISEENLEALFREEFDHLTKVKALGFIAIVEREMKADLSALRKAAKNYYAEHSDENAMMTDVSVVSGQPKKRRGLVWLFLVVVIIGGALAWFGMNGWDIKKFESIKTMFPLDKMTKLSDQTHHPVHTGASNSNLSTISE